MFKVYKVRVLVPNKRDRVKDFGEDLAMALEAAEGIWMADGVHTVVEEVFVDDNGDEVCHSIYCEYEV